MGGSRLLRGSLSLSLSAAALKDSQRTPTEKVREVQTGPWRGVWSLESEERGRSVLLWGRLRNFELCGFQVHDPIILAFLE